jgi:hypothetical protein
MQLTFEHACTSSTVYTNPPRQCPVKGNQVWYEASGTPDGTAYVVPVLRCNYVNDELKLVAVNNLPV